MATEFIDRADHRAEVRPMTIVTIRHCRAHGYSPWGVRQFLAEHGFDWRSFLANGIDAEKLRATGAGPAIALADKVEQIEGTQP